MRYDDASQAGSTATDSAPVARPDVDLVPAGTPGPASGNVITGEGTVTGSAGADTVGDAPGAIVQVQGAGGATAGGAGSFQAAGQFGVLNMDAQGNFTYVANSGTPQGAADVFNYTLADADGATSSTTLTFNIGSAAAAAAVQGVVNLPPGVEMSDIKVSGRDLIITLPDGSQMVIPGGAVFVPQLVIGDVQVPASNLAALLIESEPQPAAGQLQSSGGNFANPVPPLDPGVPLGDLIPPTELAFTPPDFQEIFDAIDRDPVAGALAGQLDDDDVPGKNGNAGGTGDDVGAPNATFSGFLPGSDGDGDLEWALLGTGAPAGFTYAVQPDGTLLVQQVQNGSTVTVLTITVNSATGEVTVTETNPVFHPAGGDENNVEFVINYSVTDENGDEAIGTLTVNVDDDTPTVSVQAGSDANVILTTDDAESIPGDGNPDSAATSINFGGVFTGTVVSAGADGAGPGSSTSYALAVTAQNSGLTSHGSVINLFRLADGTVVGTTAAAAPANTADPAIVFTLTVTNTGVVTLTQLLQVDHPIASDPTPTTAPFADHIVSMADGLITLTRSETLTDRDGDSVTGSASVNIGANLRFTDDGPTAAVNQEARDAPVTVDETRPEGTDTPDGGAPLGLASATINFADNFLAADFGADGAGSTTYQLILSADGIGSGIFALEGTDTSASDGDGYGQGAEITLTQTNSTTITGSAGGVNYFTLTVDASGVVTFTQLNPVWHPTPGDFDETVTLNTESANDIVVQQTVIDFDGDTATAAVPIGRGLFNIQDDGPDEFGEDCPSAITVNEIGSEVTASLLLPDVGEDEPGKVTFVVEDGEAVVDSGGDPVDSQGTPLFYFINDQGVLEARAGDANGDIIFTITINGDGTFTYEQFGIIGSAGGVTFNNLTGADAGNVDIRTVGHDDPATTVDLILSGSGAGGADEGVNTDSNSIGVDNQSVDLGETLRIDLVSNLQTTAVAAGTPLGLTYDAHVDTTSFLQTVPQVQGEQDQTVAFQVWALDTSDTQANEPDRDPAGGFDNSTIVTVTSATVIGFNVGEGAAVTVDISAVAVGVWTDIAYGIAVQKQADGSVIFTGVQQGDQYGVATGSSTFNAIAVQSEAIATGPVGNLSSQDSFDLGVFSIGSVNDVEPVDINVPIALTDADGDPVICDIELHLGVPLVAADVTVTVNEAGLPVIGSDAASDSEIQSGNLTPSGGTGPYSFTLIGANADGDGDFGTLILNPDTGAFTYTLDTPFDTNPEADDGTNPELGKDSFDVLITDSLGATHTTTITVNIIDDVPTANNDGNLDTVDDNSAGVTIGTAAEILGNDVYGADGQGSPAIVIGAGSLGGTVSIVGGNLVYTAGPGGNVTPGDPNKVETFTYTIEDGDGDTDTATFTVTLTDEGPAIDQTAASIAVDEEGLTNGLAGTVYGDLSDLAGQATSQTGNLSGLDFGSDGPGDIVLTAVADTGLRTLSNQVVASSWNGTTHTLTGFVDLDANGLDAGDVTVFTLQIDNVNTGHYVFNLLQPVKHATADTEDNATFSVGVTVTDLEGDPASGSIDILIDDDSPVAADEAQQNVAEGNQTISGTFDFQSGADTPTTVTHINGTALVFDVGTGWSQWIAVDDGQIRAQADGDYQFESDAAGSGVTSGNYTVTDADGDTDIGTWAFNITDANAPTAGSSTALLDDDGLVGSPAGVLEAGNGDINANTGEVATADPSEAVFHGDLNADFGGDGAGTINFAAMVGEFRMVGTERVHFTWDVATLTLTAVVDATSDGVTAQARAGTSLFKVVLDPTFNGNYTLTLLDNVLHAAGGNEANAPNVALTFNIIDSDNSPVGGVQGTLNVTFNDDTPDVVAALNTDAAVELDESLPSTASTITLDGVTKGNDPDLVDTDGIAIGRAVSAESVLTLTSAVYGADGPAADPDDAVYSLTVDNAVSGLTTTEGHAINLVSQQNGTVVVGIVQAGPFINQAAFAIYINPETGIITVEQYLSLDHPTNPDPNDPLSMTAGHVSAVVTIEDGDGDTDASTAIDISGLITFRDDGPVAIQPVAATLENEIGATVTRDLDNDSEVLTDFGADGPGLVQFANITSGVTDSGLDSGGSNIILWLSNNGQTLQGRTGSTDGTDGALIFTVALNQADGDYTVTMAGTIDNGSGVTFSNLSGGVAGNPPFKLITEPGVTLEILATPINGGSINSDTDDMGVDGQFIQILDDDADPGNPADDATLQLDFGNFTYDANGGGTSDDAFVMVSHQNINGFRWTIDQISEGTTADIRLTAIDADNDGGVEEQAPNPAGDALDPITAVKIFQVTEVGGVLVYTQIGPPGGYTTDSAIGATGATIDFEVGGTVLLSNMPSDYAIQTYTATGYSRLQIANAGDDVDSGDNDGKFSVSQFSIETSQAGTARNLDLDLKITDGDGDPVTMVGAIDITFNPATPVALDLDGDGVEFVDRSAGVSYDYGSGLAATAWVGPDDAILVRDANGNGTVDDASEFVFGGNGLTDLEALAAQYGSTLDASDADFGKFAVWQDANSNGVADSGEVNSLTALGITSIGLVSDGIAYAAANGDVSVAGSASYTNADGSTGIVADAAFSTGARAAEDQLRTSTAMVSNAALIGAIAAAGLAAAEPLAAASNTDDESSTSEASGGQHNQAFAPVALDTASDSQSSDLIGQSDSGDGAAQVESLASPGNDNANAPAGLDSVNGAADPAGPTELPQGTDLPAGDAPAQVTAAAIAMPDADQLLTAASENGEASAVGGGGQHNQIVGQVLVDALQGGGDGPSIDSLVNSLPQVEQAGSAADALAAVSNVDSGVFAAFTGGADHIMDMAMHHDAAPAAV